MGSEFVRDDEREDCLRYMITKRVAPSRDAAAYLLAALDAARAKLAAAEENSRTAMVGASRLLNVAIKKHHAAEQRAAALDAALRSILSDIVAADDIAGIVGRYISTEHYQRAATALAAPGPDAEDFGRYD